MKVAYETVHFRGTQPLVDEIVSFTDKCVAAGRKTSVQQIYVWLASRGLADWDESERERVARLIGKARLGGLVDWDVIVDLVTETYQEEYWERPEDMLHACAKQYRIDRWADQPVYVECWVGHRPAGSVIAETCRAESIPYVVHDGTASWGDLWAATVRIRPRLAAGKEALVLFFGDLNPQGLVAAQSCEQRLRKLIGPELSGNLRFDWLAVTLDLATLYEMRPMPLSVKHTASQRYIDKYGQKAWNLDAVDEYLITDLLTSAIENVRDDRLWRAACRREDEGRARLAQLARNWD